MKTLYAHQATKPDPLNLFVLQEVAQGHKMDEPSSGFVYKSVYVYICWMTCNVIVYALWSVSEHDIPSFDYIMKCISWWNALINIILSCFVLGTNSATLSNKKDLLWKYLKA